MNNPESATITGRDGYIIDKALLYAIAHIQSLPENKRERSDMEDMCAIVRASSSPFIFQSLLDVEWHTGIKADLWPEPDNELSEGEKAKRDEFRSNCDGFAAMILEGIDKYAKANPATFGKVAAPMTVHDQIETVIGTLEMAGCELRATDAEQLLAEIDDPDQAAAEFRELAKILDRLAETKKEAA